MSSIFSPMSPNPSFVAPRIEGGKKELKKEKEKEDRMSHYHHPSFQEDFPFSISLTRFCPYTPEFEKKKT